jgi:1,2-diacylglycerol 3-beta-galactosyltransferase
MDFSSHREYLSAAFEHAKSNTTIMNGEEKSICIFHTEAGEGHRTAEKVIRKAMDEAARIDSFEIYRDVLADYDPAAKYLGLSSPGIYNKVVLQKGHTGLVWTVLAGLNLAYLKIMKGRLAERVAGFLQDRDYDLVIALLPLMNAVIAEGISRSENATPLLSVVTDFTEPVRGIWFQDRRQHVIVCTPEAMEQALNRGIPEENVHLLSGAPLDGEQYRPGDVDASEVREHLSGDKPVLLLLYGGHAGRSALAHLKAVENSPLEVDLVCVCGRNQALREDLASRSFQKLKLVTGFVSLPPYYEVADLVIGKPGPGVITEAAHMDTPLLLELNSKTMAQERFNAKWAAERGIAETFADGGELADKLPEMLKPEKLEAYRARTREIENNSMEELGKIIRGYLGD